MTDCVNSFGLDALQHVLTIIKANPDANVTKCRPSNVRHYLQVISEMFELEIVELTV